MDRAATRATATFVPYYWEAYNEIVEPRRFDHYLLTKWLPDLGPIGFTIVKLLRDRCYFNPEKGVLRDTCEMSMDELAVLIGVSRAYLFKLFKDNAALGQFVRRIEQYQFVDGRPRQDKNRYQICMDDPIHPTDLEHYDDLRALKETERHQQPVTRVFKGRPGVVDSEAGPNSYESTTKTHSAREGEGADSYESTTETHRTCYESTTKTPDTKYPESTTKTPDTKYPESTTKTAIGNGLPFGDLSKGSVTPDTPADSPQPNGFPEGGAEESTAPPELLAAWPVALKEIAEVVNPPTYHTHIKPLVPLDLNDSGEVSLLVPTAFTRSWLETRHLPTLEGALRKALGRAVTVRLTQIGPAAAGTGERSKP
jgi:hypothetical protein